MTTWLDNVLGVIRALGQILTAGIAITAFALLLYSFAFNLRNQVARSFSLILTCLVIIFSAEAIASTASQTWEFEFWPRLQWVGIAFLPSVYFQFSDALLATTGRPSRWRRRFVVRLVYVASILFTLSLLLNIFSGPVISFTGPAPHLQSTLVTDVFVFFYIGVMALAWVNFIRAYRRTTTNTSRRRMAYLITGAIAPAVGAFPFLPYSPEFAANHLLIFWSITLLSNLIVGTLLVVMGYSVAFFGVAWPDRVIKGRLFKWLMRGPFAASLTLAVVTLLRRSANALGYNYDALVPIAMVGTILIIEYLIICCFIATTGRNWKPWTNWKTNC